MPIKERLQIISHTYTIILLHALQKAAFDKAAENVAIGRVLLGNLLIGLDNDGQFIGQQELLEACPTVLQFPGSSLGITSEVSTAVTGVSGVFLTDLALYEQGWLSCYVSLPELLPMTDLKADLELLVQSLTTKIPWLTDVVRPTGITAVDQSGVLADFSLADRQELATQLRAAWSVAGRQRSQLRTSILSFFNSATKAAQLESFSR